MFNPRSTARKGRGKNAQRPKQNRKRMVLEIETNLMELVGLAIDQAGPGQDDLVAPAVAGMLARSKGPNK